MSLSAQLQIQGAIAAALSVAVPGVSVHLNRMRPVDRESASAVLIRLQGSQDASGPIGAQDWLTTFEVECIARGVSGSDPAAACDALLQSVWAALVALSLAGLDVVEINARPQIDWALDAADTPLVSASFRLDVLHRTHPETILPWSA